MTVGSTVGRVTDGRYKSFDEEFWGVCGASVGRAAHEPGLPSLREAGYGAAGPPLTGSPLIEPPAGAGIRELALPDPGYTVGFVFPDGGRMHSGAFNIAAAFCFKR